MSTLTSPVDIRADHLEIVQDILCTHLPAGFEVWVFGSRANWTTKDSSDLDLAVEGVASLDHGVMVGLEIAFEESNLPYTVDVVDLNAVSPGFKRIVEDQRVLLPSMATSHLPDKKIVAGRHDTTQGWHQVNLGDIAEIFDGPHATPQKTEDGPVFLGISNLVNGRIDISTAEHLSDSDYATWTKRVIPQPGDIVFSYETRLGEAAAIPLGLQCCLGRRMGLLRVSKELVDPQFLLYAYLGPEFQGTLQSRTVQGSTVDRILLTELGTFPIRIPLLPEQRAIAHILGTLDDKIELNRRMNQTLEAMARAIFQDWFVDFGPVRAKMEGQDPYLPPELWDLFPEDLVDSELGEIPEGWKVKTLKDLIKLNPAQPMAKGQVAPYLDMAALPTGECSPETPVLREYTSGTRFQNRDTLLARITPCLENGKTAFVQTLPKGETGWGSTEFIVMRGTPPVPAEYTYLLARDINFRSQAIQSMTGTSGRQRVRTDTLSTYPLPSPSPETWAVFGKLVQPLFEKIRANDKETSILKVERQALLPQLISRDVRVVDKEVKEVSRDIQ